MHRSSILVLVQEGEALSVSTSPRWATTPPPVAARSLLLLLARDQKGFALLLGHVTVTHKDSYHICSVLDRSFSRRDLGAYGATRVSCTAVRVTRLQYIGTWSTAEAPLLRRVTANCCIRAPGHRYVLTRSTRTWRALFTGCTIS